MEAPHVSIIIPCRNEENFIRKCLDSIVENDYPKNKLEVLVVDGMSIDGTRAIIKKYTEKHPFINILDNNRRIVPSALNIGIQHAKGEIIIRMDAHNIYTEDYISKCVKYSQKYNVDNVGGIWITLPANNSFIAYSIALVLSHPFGVGNAHFRLGSKEPRYVDTVPFGCYRREVFDRIGLFNENLVRNQDIEFNLRLRRMGGKILLVPNVVSYYYARSTLKDLGKNNFCNGFWILYSLKFAKIPFSIRHLIPFILVSSLLSSIALSLIDSVFIYLFIFIISIYSITNVLFSFLFSIKKGLKYFPLLIMSFFTLHISYGLGSIWGIIRLAISQIQR